MSLRAVVRPLFQRETYRALLFLGLAAPIGAVTLAVVIAGWTATGVLAVTPLVVPVLVSFRAAIGALARLDSAFARVLLGVETSPRILSGGSGYWGRSKAVLADGGFWRQQAYLAVRTTVGFGLAVAEFSLLSAAVGTALFPLLYRWSDLHFWSWQVDSFARSLVLVPVGFVGLVVAAHLARLLGAASAWLAGALLGRDRADPLTPELMRRARLRALRVNAGMATAIGSLLVLIWAVTDNATFWPVWALLSFALVVGIHGWVELVEERPQLRRGPVLARGFAIHAGVSAALLAFFVAVWAVTGRSTFWPIWTMVAAIILLGAHAVAAYAATRRRLARRVDVLEATRSGAVNVQEAELRRIERDLHDGAQARLVALGMNLGMAEQTFESDPEGARQLVTEARAGVGEALRELRDLARGIHPPVLSDRGLAAALGTLADQSGLPVSVSTAIDGRPAPPVETAAYFVAAEALANAAKHSGAGQIAIRVYAGTDVLEIEIEDNGRGGADLSGSGLTGLRQRVEALDGTLAVTSPLGGPTIVRAELPCAS